MKYILLLTSLLLLLPNFFSIDTFPVPQYNHRENFDPHLSYINTIDKLDAHIDSIAHTQPGISPDLSYVEIVESTIQQRFYHGYCKDNYLVYRMDKK
jgi:hypothetical protein